MLRDGEGRVSKTITNCLGTKLSGSIGFKKVYRRLKFEYVRLNRHQVMRKVHVIFDNPSYMYARKLSGAFDFQGLKYDCYVHKCLFLNCLKLLLFIAFIVDNMKYVHEFGIVILCMAIVQLEAVNNPRRKIKVTSQEIRGKNTLFESFLPGGNYCAWLKNQTIIPP